MFLHYYCRRVLISGSVGNLLLILFPSNTQEPEPEPRSIFSELLSILHTLQTLFIAVIQTLVIGCKYIVHVS